MTGSGVGRGARPVRPQLDAYPFQTALTTRWADNDVYGHINNVAYYGFFDTAANEFLIARGGMDLATSSVIGLVVESQCHFHAPLAYPQRLRVGVRVDRLGTSSVTYGLAVAAEGDPDVAAHGHVVHVFVERATRRPTAMPAPLRAALESIAAPVSATVAQ